MKGSGGMLAWNPSIRISGFVSALVVEVLLPVFEWFDEREAIVAGIFRIGRFVGFSAFTGPDGFSDETAARMMRRWVEENGLGGKFVHPCEGNRSCREG
ncbi:hypothetical protein Vadar_011966 [Vaccinium darrowii]|uniref:Uncharacterized protein n=1 Tax=Vaccinium darrowii TaxID=229202 RepID=A0ACB7ZIP6_9ERIC|nr:hypothetical protein Vadar_011966 [Vaccinium darrowii]